MTDPTFAAALTPEQLDLSDDELRRQGLPVPSPRERERMLHRRQRAALQQAELAQDAERPRSRFIDPKAPEPHALPTWARRQLEQPPPQSEPAGIPPAENCPAKPDSGEEERPAGAVQEFPGRGELTPQQVLAATKNPSALMGPPPQRRRRKGAHP